MANWEKDLGMAGQYAGIGASIGSVIPGVGTAIGGVVGGIGGAIAGLLSGDDPKPQLPDDPNRGMRAKFINELSSNKMSDTATNASARARRSFLDSMDSYKNIPGIGNNAAVRSKLNVNAQDALGENLVNIDTQDAQSRLRNHEQAAELMGQQSAIDASRNEKNLTLAQQPSFLETLGQLGTSKLAGGVTSLLTNGMGKEAGTTPEKDGSDAGDGDGGFYDKLINPKGADANPLNYKPVPLPSLMPAGESDGWPEPLSLGNPLYPSSRNKNARMTGAWPDSGYARRLFQAYP